MPRFPAALNEQVGSEFGASQQYVAIAVHYDALTLPQLAAHFYRQAVEERNHAMMLVQYLLDGDETGAGAAATVVGTHVLVQGQTPLDQAAAPVAGVVHDVGEVLVVLVADPCAARVLGAVLAHVGELVVHLGANRWVAEVAVPRDAAERPGEDRLHQVFEEAYAKAFGTGKTVSSGSSRRTFGGNWVAGGRGSRSPLGR